MGKSIVRLRGKVEIWSHVDSDGFVYTDINAWFGPNDIIELVDQLDFYEEQIVAEHCEHLLIQEDK